MRHGAHSLGDGMKERDQGSSAHAMGSLPSSRLSWERSAVWLAGKPGYKKTVPHKEVHCGPRYFESFQPTQPNPRAHRLRQWQRRIEPEGHLWPVQPVQSTLGLGLEGGGMLSSPSQTQPTGILVRLSSPGSHVPHWAAAPRLAA